MLRRGSAFLLDTAKATRDGSSVTRSRVSDLAVLTCQHVACPWLFPKYFADKWDWLQFVSEEFVQHSLQLLELPPPTPAVAVHRHTPGDNYNNTHQRLPQQQQLFVPRVLAEIPLQRHVRLHPSRDVAMLSLCESLEGFEWDTYLGKEWNLELLTLQESAKSCDQGEVVLFIGHKQFGSEELAQAATRVDEIEGVSAEDVGQYPKEVVGNFVGQSSQGQAFAWSEEILEEGMCGGAVMNTDGECIGLVEGIVPPFIDASADAATSDGANQQSEADTAAAMRKALANHVAFVPARDIASFVEEKGQYLATGTLLGLEDENDDELW